MDSIINLLFQARMLKEIPRSGFHFLGSGKESVAEHSFSVAFIGYVMAEMVPEADAKKLITMCLVHDLAEARIGDLNYVQKKYVTADEKKAVEDTVRELPFGKSLSSLIQEFNDNQTLEAQLAKDADQLALILDLKNLSDIGFGLSNKWLPAVLKRLTTDTGRILAEKIMNVKQDSWWISDYTD